MRYDRITVEPDKMGGVPCIRGLRFAVATVVGMVAEGMTTDEIVAEHLIRGGGHPTGARIRRRSCPGA